MKNVIFSDEVLLHLVQTRQRRFVRHQRGGGRQNDVYQPQLQAGGGSVMVWSAIPLHRVCGTLTSVSYVAMLSDCLLLFLQQHDVALTFQQDYATAHKVQNTLNWFRENNIIVMDWPPWPIHGLSVSCINGETSMALITF